MKINNFSPRMLILNKNNYPQDQQSYSLIQTSNEQTSNNQSELSNIEQILSPNVPSIADQSTNSLNIKSGEIKNIGEVDGLPVNVSLDSYGMNTSFGITINSKDPVDSDRTKFALLISNRYTQAQQDKANSIITRFEFLYGVANGDISVNLYNQTNDLGQYVSTSELLTSLGIDASKPFTFNGKSFSLDTNGNLHSLLQTNQLNITQ